MIFLFKGINCFDFLFFGGFQRDGLFSFASSNVLTVPIDPNQRKPIVYAGVHLQYKDIIIRIPINNQNNSMINGEGTKISFTVHSIYRGQIYRVKINRILLYNKKKKKVQPMKSNYLEFDKLGPFLFGTQKINNIDPKYRLSPQKYLSKKKRDCEVLITISDCQNIKQEQSTIMEDYKNLLKTTCKDVRKVRDAVMVKSIPIVQKENNNEGNGKKIKNSNDLLMIEPKRGVNRRATENMSFDMSQIKSSDIKIKKSREKIDYKQEVKKSNFHQNINQPIDKNVNTSDSSKSSGKINRFQRNDRILEVVKCPTIPKKNQINKYEIQYIAGKMICQNKGQTLIDEKLTAYFHQIRKNRQLYALDDSIVDKSDKTLRKTFLKVFIKKGNNSQLIKWVFKKRWWWVVEDQKDSHKTLPHFIWSQLKDKKFFSCEKSGQSGVHSHNHFPHNQYLGNKKALLYNMSSYYKKNNKNVFDYLPETYHIVKMGDSQWDQFSQKYQNNANNNRDNTWIIKPGQNSNRGFGIMVTNKIQQIVDIVSGKQEHKTHILQKYINQPFLYNARKFDIRTYMMIAKINNKLRGFWYQDGYVRTSSSEFQLDNFDMYVHLTNDAIQNNSESYGKYQEANKLSYASFQKYLDTKFPSQKYNFNEKIIPTMKQIAVDAIKASYQSIIGTSSNYPIFEIFGLDFMIDANFKPWLIEVNTNPCLETSSNIMRKIIPKMLDDALKLTLDVLYLPTQKWPSSKKHSIPSLNNKFQMIFSVDSIQKEIYKQIKVPGSLSEDEEVYDENE